MHFTTPLLTLLASTSLAAVLPRSGLGSWAVTINKASYANGYKSLDISAVYTSDSYPDGISSSCSTVKPSAADPEQPRTCSAGFEASYDGSSVSLQQTVELPINATVFGSGPIKLTTSGAGRIYTGSATVEVTSATA
ncbi:hypothetical protein EK21DRAFT_93677 [Setomelanomma holmii]|uniref:Uncharacterized protein n=1 Tax=Setomelanomma holmii TaxID=210430 RepID=A0A9P4GYB9_9PLEO|nr:hypothetical protein EK21DRAFT_93677 [Setomelanomma holmii]